MKDGCLRIFVAFFVISLMSALVIKITERVRVVSFNYNGETAVMLFLSFIIAGAFCFLVYKVADYREKFRVLKDLEQENLD